MRRTLLIAVLQLVHIASWAAYYALTRELYSGEPGFLVRLAAAETLPTAVGLLGGAVAERRGYRTALALGLLEGLFLASAGVFIHRPLLLWASALLASLFWSMAGPQVLGYSLTITRGSGSRLGVVLAGGTLGWSLGGSVAPLAARVLGPGRVVAAGGAAVVLVYLVLALLSGGTRPARRSGEDASRSTLAAMMLLSSLVFTGTEVIGSVYMAKLSVEAGNLGYAAANAATGLMAAAARPLAGRVIDRAGSGLVLAASLAAYTVYTLLLHSLHGLGFVAVWLIPLYPFLDTSLYKLAASLLGDAMGTAAVISGYSLAGAVLLAASQRGLGVWGYTLLAVTAFQLALALAVLLAGRAGELRLLASALLKGGW
ncbi:hypothetical protein CF15_00920 [Pyrodictium occultum]|uniref:Major facilitator superfamily (MFS) profile domain-containing protein n=1 Tax=Pyrodictium occultum TaxID=2309 RepID=A0A0V8RU31_PYROC|nr:hypothetical protein [Pyrodictium occultum]KSW11450.1 hypothetical protein CF15_00920 [Pyrodictium occultum]